MVWENRAASYREQLLNCPALVLIFKRDSQGRWNKGSILKCDCCLLQENTFTGNEKLTFVKWPLSLPLFVFAFETQQFFYHLFRACRNYQHSGPLISAGVVRMTGWGHKWSAMPSATWLPTCTPNSQFPALIQHVCLYCATIWTILFALHLDASLCPVGNGTHNMH